MFMCLGDLLEGSGDNVPEVGVVRVIGWSYLYGNLVYLSQFYHGHA
jgi:hypothetical protein